MANMTKEVKPILDVFDKAREILGNKMIENEIAIPTTVVIGDQSSGKSSVMESICKINLPKGEDMVTKCPIVLQLRSLEEKDGDEDFALIKLGGNNLKEEPGKKI